MESIILIISRTQEKAFPDVRWSKLRAETWGLMWSAFLLSTAA